MKKKIGLATCFLDNYGACLQAYALQEKIKQLGYDCRIIPFIEPGGYYKQSTPLQLLKTKIFNKKGYETHKKKITFSEFRGKNLQFEKDAKGKIVYYETYEQLENAELKYDAYVCGSDQIWNPTFYGKNNPAYFLRFAKGKKKVAYAPSIGLSELPEEYKEVFKEYVADFHVLSTREEAGTEIVKTIGGRECTTVLDPTLLMGGDFWVKKVKKPSGVPYKKYVLCYMFSNTKETSEYLKKVQESCGLPIVYLPISELSYDGINSRCVVADPLEFLWLIKNAEFVVTDSFHGSAFSVMFHKKIVLVNRNRNGQKIDMSSRLVNLMSMAGIDKGFVDLEKPLDLGEDTDYRKVDENLQKYRTASEEYLKAALEFDDENS